MAAPSFLRSRTRVVATAAVVVAALAVAVLVAPWPARLGAATTGDARLADRVRDLAGGKRVGLAVATIDGDRVTTAGLGDDGHGRAPAPTTPFEIGSVTKTFTAAIFASALAKGTVRADEKVRDAAPGHRWRRGGVGDSTLAELASHRSGLPPQALDLSLVPGRYASTLFGWSPPASSTAEVFRYADAAPVAHRGEHVYSNLGMALLGQILAERAGVSYSELLRRDVTGPLGLRHTEVPADAPPAGAVAGHDETGRVVGDWLDAGNAPAGAGVWSTLSDMAAYTRAMIAGTVPGEKVTTKPRYDAGAAGRIGYAWYTLTLDGRTVVWKNGGSGGCSSSVVYEPATGRGVVVLSNSSAFVDDVAFGLLGLRFGGGGLDLSPPGLVGLAVGALFPPLAGASLLAAVRGGWRRRPRKPVRRSGLVGAVGTSVLLLALAYAISPATYLLAPFWLLGWALSGAGLAGVVRRWPELGHDDAKGRVGRWVGAAIACALGAAVTAGVAG